MLRPSCSVFLQKCSLCSFSPFHLKCLECSQCYFHASRCLRPGSQEETPFPGLAGKQTSMQVHLTSPHLLKCMKAGIRTLTLHSPRIHRSTVGKERVTIMFHLISRWSPSKLHILANAWVVNPKCPLEANKCNSTVHCTSSSHNWEWELS